jgi:hypothetical protein
LRSSLLPFGALSRAPGALRRHRRRASSRGIAPPCRVFTRVRSPASGYQAPRSRHLAASRSSGLPRSRCSRSAIESGSFLSWAYASLQSLTRTGPSFASPRSTAPLRFIPSQRSRCRESTSPGLPSPDVPPPGFRTLLAACSSRNPPGLFHPGGALRVLALRSLPFRRSLTPRRRSLYPRAVGRSPAAGS